MRNYDPTSEVSFKLRDYKGFVIFRRIKESDRWTKYRWI